MPLLLKDKSHLLLPLLKCVNDAIYLKSYVTLTLIKATNFVSLKKIIFNINRYHNG